MEESYKMQFQNLLPRIHSLTYFTPNFIFHFSPAAIAMDIYYGNF